MCKPFNLLTCACYTTPCSAPAQWRAGLFAIYAGGIAIPCVAVTYQLWKAGGK